MKKTSFFLLLIGCLLLSGCVFKYTNDSRGFVYKFGGPAGIVEFTCSEQPSKTEITIDNPIEAQASTQASIGLKEAAYVCQEFLNRKLSDPGEAENKLITSKMRGFQ